MRYSRTSIFLNIFLNYLEFSVTSGIAKFADNTKLYKNKC